jgi:LysR family cys regulon transcriptional activator
LCEVVKQGLRISAAAEALHTSQPGVSRQILELEEELGVDIFVRRRRRIIAVSEPGRALIALAQRIVRDAENMRSVAADYSGEGVGVLTIATTHTHACYTLPKFIRAFSARFPNVALHLREGAPAQCCEMVAQAEADIGVITEPAEALENIATLPAYRLPRCLVTPVGHPLLKSKPLTLEKIARFPLITYDSGFSSRRSLDRAFAKKGLTPNVVLRAIDADVSKTYVSLGLGVAILPKIAVEPGVDQALRVRDLEGLLEHGLVNVCLRTDSRLRDYVYAFIAGFAPHLTRRVVDKALRGIEGDSPVAARDVPFADF